MKNQALLASLLLPAIALAQTSQTTCVNTQPVSTCTTTTNERHPAPQVVAPDIAGAVLEGRRRALEDQQLVEQTKQLQLQNEALRQQLVEHQRMIEAEAVVIRQALVAYVDERSKLPQEQQAQSSEMAARRIGEIAQSMLGHPPSAEAVALAAKQLQSIQIPQ